MQVHASLQTFSLPPTTAAAASIAAAHLLFVILDGVVTVQIGVFSLAVDRHAWLSVPSLDFETTIGVLGSVAIVWALQRHGVDDDRAGVIIRAQLGSGNADVSVRVVQRQIHIRIFRMEGLRWKMSGEEKKEGSNSCSFQSDWRSLCYWCRSIGADCYGVAGWSGVCGRKVVKAQAVFF